MNLSSIIDGYSINVLGDAQIEVSGLYCNSKEVKKGGMFFVISGTKDSGYYYIDEAIQNGATVIVSRLPISPDYNITNVIVEDVRKAMSLYASNYYGKPSNSLFIVGVTGTNGKTSTTFMLKSVYEKAGLKVGVIGTNGIFLGEERKDNFLTTPDPIILQKTLFEMQQEMVDVVCIEISAHALELQKIWGVMIDIALFTNLTQDHLDFFKSMEKYGEAKAKLFDKNQSKLAVINVDDEFGNSLVQNINIPVLTYSQKENINKSYRKADIIAYNKKHSLTNQEFEISSAYGKQKICLNICGEFNISNALGVIGAALLSGIDLSIIKEGLESLEKIEGRFNVYDVGGTRVIIDYAHTPDGLCNILKSARKITDKKLICVFGCGGNRDSEKRSIMGNISSLLADYTIITNDNPRFENPESIAKEIENGMTGNSVYSIVLDRRKAINLAVSISCPGDTIVIAGKGIEPYIDIMGEKIDYQDQKVIQDLINSFESNC